MFPKIYTHRFYTICLCQSHNFFFSVVSTIFEILKGIKLILTLERVD